MFHQVTSLAYDHILRQGVSLHSLFTALTWSDYYPPLVHLTVAGFYQLFGVSMDVAAMANSLYLALLLLAVYGIGERLAGPWVGLLSAFLVSLLPMVFAMSRYLYLDFALTAMVATNVCLLLRSDRFQRRGYALLYGLSLGLGLLVKWTFVVFVAGPLLVALLRRDTLAAAWQAARRALTLRDGGFSSAKRLGVAALLGLAVTALWFVPNVQTTAALTLGYGLVPLSWLMWTFTWLFVLAPSSRGSNLLAALGLGACVASGLVSDQDRLFARLLRQRLWQADRPVVGIWPVFRPDRRRAGVARPGGAGAGRRCVAGRRPLRTACTPGAPCCRTSARTAGRSSCGSSSPLSSCRPRSASSIPAMSCPSCRRWASPWPSA